MSNLHARSPGEYPVKSLCGLFGVSKQAYYKHNEERAMLYMVQEEFVVQYTREILGWSVGETLSTKHPIEALRMALAYITSHGGGTNGLIHHSDRGCQYASHEYVNLLKTNNVRISMTEGGDPRDNAQAERINNTMKNELLKGKVFTSVEEVKVAVAQAVEFYNNRRPHMSIDMMTPSEARLRSGPIRKLWRSYREENILRGMVEGGPPDLSELWSPSGLRPPVNHSSA